MVPPEGFKDPAQRQKALENAFKSVALEKPDPIFLNSKTQVPGVAAGLYAAEGYTPRSGAGYQEVLAKLKEQGVKPRGFGGGYSDEQRVQAYQLMQEEKRR